ncbi:MAG: hypothetical protein MRZ45_05370 [Blautia sp.]|nr:hypothetical protein [Blautia sp.]
MKAYDCHRGEKSLYDDGNIPEIDLPRSSSASRDFPPEFEDNGSIPVEDDRPRKDGPGGE